LGSQGSLRPEALFRMLRSEAIRLVSYPDQSHERLHSSPFTVLETADCIHEAHIVSGRIQYLHMGPMTFTEYLEALGENKPKEESRGAMSVSRARDFLTGG
jgi:hypothetical protein